MTAAPDGSSCTEQRASFDAPGDATASGDVLVGAAALALD